MKEQRNLHTVDAEGKIAGRLASQIAILLQGKHKVTYMPHTDCGDMVQVQNVDKMKFSGNKMIKELYHRFTGYPGGIRTTRLDEFFKKNPEKLLKLITKNMLPKNKLQARMLKRLSFIHTKGK